LPARAVSCAGSKVVPGAPALVGIVGVVQRVSSSHSWDKERERTGTEMDKENGSIIGAILSDDFEQRMGCA